jgi:succinate-semialdehyde dehydrogenase/glutarate-semialdehyde dehydrogenase
VRPEPLGVVAAFTPWNYPAVIIARKLGAALAAGCTVVLKAAEETPTIAAMLVSALEEAGLPRGVVNLVFGNPPAIAAQLLDTREVRAVSFTGSTAVGRQIAARASTRLQRCVLELGGHAPVVVFGDADVEVAARAIAAYKFECAGQSCNAPSRIYVHESIYGAFVETLAVITDRICLGDGVDCATDMGPLATARRLAAVQRLVADARAHGGRVLTGGARPERRGWFFRPTLVTDVRPGAALCAEEPFGPIAPIWPFTTFEEGVARANASTYGLAAYVFTRDEQVARSASTALAAGSVGVNELRGVPPDVGIAGINDSGHGYEGGALGIEAFLNLKVVRGSARSRDT